MRRRVRPLGHGRVDTVGGGVGVEHVEAGGRHPVESGDTPVVGRRQRRLPVVTAVERDHAELFVLGREAVEVDPPPVEVAETTQPTCRLPVVRRSKVGRP